MLIPRTRLIAATAFVAIPASISAFAIPNAQPFAAAAILLLVTIAVLDAARSLSSAVPAMRAELPAVVRLTKDRAGEIPVHIHVDSPRCETIRIGLNMPQEFSAAAESILTRLSSDTAQSIVPWPCTAAKRGSFEIENVYIDRTSPWGLWSRYDVLPARAEVRVYPNLAKERRHAPALFLNRGPFGVHAQRQVGKGREFEKLREYAPGDDYEDIHWKATARRGKPITKEFQIERTQEVYVVIDSSRLSGREITDADGESITTQLERFVSASLVLALAAERQGDLFGVVAFDSRVLKFVRAKSGAAHFNTCREALYQLQPVDVNPDFDELSTFLHLRLRKRALLILLTNLDDPVLAESFVSVIGLVARRHLVLANMPAPPGVRPIFQGPTVAGVDDIYERLGGHFLWRHIQFVSQQLRQRGVALSLLDHSALTAQLVTQYVKTKRRQAL